MKYKIGSLFAGMGGIDFAFEKAGAKIIWANEIDKYACITYRLNFTKCKLIEGDIKNLVPSELESVDIITAGFPCQSFSSVGLGGGFNDPRGNLFFEIGRIVEQKQPRVIFLENVANLINHDNGKTFNIIHATLCDLGYYYIKYNIMNAKEYGNLPQQRKRIYIVAFKNIEDMNNFEFPLPIKFKKTAFNLFEREKVADKYYLDNHWKAKAIFETVEPKYIYRFTDWGISKSTAGICPTLLAAMGSRFERIPFFKDNYSVRLLLPRECARLQGFPETYKLPNKYEKQVYKQIGNSVAVTVVTRIAKNIINALKKTDQ